MDVIVNGLSIQLKRCNHQWILILTFAWENTGADDSILLARRSFCVTVDVSRPLSHKCIAMRGGRGCD